MREQRLESTEVAVLRRREEPAGQLFALLARGLEPRAPLLHVTPRSRRDLPHVVLALVDDLRDLVVSVVEHVAQQQHRALLGREGLEQHEERHR